MRFTSVVTATSMLCLAMAAAAWGVEPAARAEARQPNIVLIVADDLGWSDLACYGNTFHQTPHLDRLAGQGMRFTSAYAAAPLCSPTRASLLTGKYPARLGMTSIIQYQPRPSAHWREPPNARFLPLAEQTLFEVLKEAGYRTGHFGKWHLGGERENVATGDPSRQGADVNLAGSDFGQPPDYFYPYQRTLPDGRRLTLPRAPEQKRPDDFLDERLTDEAEAFIEQNRDRPFFLFMSYFLPHTSMGNRLQARAEKIARYRERLGTTGPEEKAVYAAMIEHLDECVGRLMHTLDSLGLTENTIVVFTSDNGGYGDKTSNTPLRGAKSEGYEGGIRVPTLIRWPGHVAEHSISAEPIITPDLFVTLAEIGAKQSGPEVDGVSLWPLLTQGESLHRTAIFWHYPHFSPQAYSAVRSGRWKLIEFYEEAGPRHELYDLAADAGETSDLAATSLERVQELRGMLDDWRQSVGARAPSRLAE